MCNKEKLESDKLAAEIRLLEIQSSRRFQLREDFKAFSGVAGILTALIAIIGLFISYQSSLSEQHANREARAEQIYFQGLTQLSSGKPAERLNAISSLQVALHSNHFPQKTLVIASIAEALIIEHDRFVSRAMTNLLTSQGEYALNVELRNFALEYLLSKSRDLVVLGDLKSKRFWTYSRIDKLSTESESVKFEVTAYNIVKLIEKLIHSGASAKNFKDTYLLGADFSEIKFSHADFSGAILAFAKFEAATCISCDFNQSDLQGVSFKHAKLDNALFTNIDKVSGKILLDSFIRRMYLRGKSPISRINFSFSSLVNADFKGFPLFGFRDGTSGVRANIDVINPKFWHASLNAAKLEDIVIFSVGESGYYLPFYQLSGTRYYEDLITAPWFDSSRATYAHVEINRDTLIRANEEKNAHSFKIIAGQIMCSDWQNSSLNSRIKVEVDKHIQQLEERHLRRARFNGVSECDLIKNTQS
jgi:uncharacterized protein YjbI with pentapeptide repeats